MSTWYLVANQSTAKFFESTAASRAIHLMNEIEHKEGRLHEGDLVTGSKGAVFQSAGQGQQRATEPEVSATEHEAEKFAGELAGDLYKARLDGRFNKLVLVAAPSFLGQLRSALDKTTASLVVKEVDKNLAGQSSRDLEKELQQHRLM